MMLPVAGRIVYSGHAMQCHGSMGACEHVVPLESGFAWVCIGNHFVTLDDAICVWPPGLYHYPMAKELAAYKHANASLLGHLAVVEDAPTIYTAHDKSWR